MILYLVKNYVLILTVVVLPMTVFTIARGDIPVDVALPQAVFFGGFISAALTYLEFRRRRIWPLYDNLQISRFGLLGALVGATLLLYLGLWSWM
jgi:hypothetical protein